jgi:hypothetical protein
MRDCPASFTTEIEQEIWQHVVIHGAAHNGDPEEWSEQERSQIRDLNRLT